MIRAGYATNGRQRRRRWSRLALPLLALIALLAAACGGDDDDSAAPEPAVQEPAAEAPAEVPDAEEPVDEAPAAEEPEAEEPAVEEPAVEEPAVEEPAAEAPAELTEVNYQLGWLADNGVLGEVVAKTMGWYAEEGIELKIDPGGPSIDGVAQVASGKATIGQLSSSPSAMLAVSQGIPLQVFAVGTPEHPYAFFSKGDTPLNSPDDLRGLVVGRPGDGRDPGGGPPRGQRHDPRRPRRPGDGRRRHHAAADRPSRRVHRLGHQRGPAQPGARPQHSAAVGRRCASLRPHLLRVPPTPSRTDRRSWKAGCGPPLGAGSSPRPTPRRPCGC